MATTAPFYTTPPNSQPNIQGPLHARTPFSPVHSAVATPMNQSPSSPSNNALFPNFPLATRQLRGPKSPMYVPAVLRPTERPPRSSPLTPPRSVHGSTDSLDGAESVRPTSRRSTTDSKKSRKLGQVIEDEPIPTEDLAPVIGPPSRGHWKPDANALICDAPICQKAFSLFERRHHCRHCGHVFCNAHSYWRIPLNQDADYHPKGAQVRSCQHCFDQYGKWKSARISRANSIHEQPASTPNTPIKGAPSRGPDQKTVANSVPRDWNWSTF